MTMNNMNVRRSYIWAVGITHYLSPSQGLNEKIASGMPLGMPTAHSAELRSTETRVHIACTNKERRHCSYGSA
eukprot:6189492-Pleurochrysis_carterae.AAC.2